MSERQKDLIRSRLFGALTVSKRDAAICTTTRTEDGAARARLSKLY